MPGRIRSRTGKLAAPAALVALLAASAALAAPGADHARGAKLGGRVQHAILDLYALDSRLHSAQARVSYLETMAASLQRRRSGLRQELVAAQSTLTVSQQDLAIRLRDVYEHGSVDPLAVVFGSSSLGNGLRKLDALKRSADESSQVAAATRKARARLLQARQTLAADGQRLERSLAAARSAERSLEGSVAARTSYVASLQREVSRTQVHTVVAQAHAAVKKSQTLQPPAPPPVTAPTPGGRKLTVSATCYILGGTTATGMPVGKGVVAVDPSVIPLGSKLYIPGYGKGVAADVGGGIKGAIIDLWYPSYSQCAKWGRRTVTITIY